jgi:hypothetical protein
VLKYGARLGHAFYLTIFCAGTARYLHSLAGGNVNPFDKKSLQNLIRGKG